MTDYVQPASHTSRLSLRERIATYFSQLTSQNNDINQASSTKNLTSFSKKYFKIFIVILAILIFVAGFRAIYKRYRSEKTVQGQQIEAIPEALTVPIESEFKFVVYDKDKVLSDPIKYTIVSAQLTDQIIIQGQKATATKGRAFLIINLKLVNDIDKSLFLNTRNYVRIQPVGTEDKLASEIHNDTVEVQPLSTKLTRIGLPVNDTDREFVLHVGELDGDKQEIPIMFQT